MKKKVRPLLRWSLAFPATVRPVISTFTPGEWCAGLTVWWFTGVLLPVISFSRAYIIGLFLYYIYKAFSVVLDGKKNKRDNSLLFIKFKGYLFFDIPQFLF
jgi:hypothetical protein